MRSCAPHPEILEEVKAHLEEMGGEDLRTRSSALRRLGFLGISTRSIRRPGPRLLLAVVLSRRWPGPGCGGLAWRSFGPGRDGHPAGLQVRHGGAEAALGVPGDPRRAHRRHGHDRARRRQRPRRHYDHGVRDGDHLRWSTGRRSSSLRAARRLGAWCDARQTGSRGHRATTSGRRARDSGFQVRATLEKLGMHSSDTAELLFENCRVPGRQPHRRGGQGFKNLMWELQGERMIAAPPARSRRSATFEYTMEYARNRQASAGPSLSSR